MLDELFPEELVAVVEGGVEESTSLLREPFDYIFLLVVLALKSCNEAAAKQLTPLTHFRTWRKSPPCIVHKDAKIEMTARREFLG